MTSSALIPTSASAWRRIAELPSLVEVWSGQELQREAGAIGASRIAGFIEQRVGFGHVERIDLNLVGVKFRRVLGDRPSRGLGIAEEDGVDDELLVDGMRNGLPDLEVGEFLAAMVDLDDKLVGQRLVAGRIDLEPLDLLDTRQIGERYRREGREIDLACLSALAAAARSGRTR